MKPGGKSRGRGIEVHDNLEDMLKSIMVSKDTVWVTQKYIESPRIILGKKFDIRVWVVITSVEPLRIWFFNKPYLRFTAEDYDSSKLRNKFSHLTNATINKDHQGKNKSKEVGKYKISHNMWHVENFQEYIGDKYSHLGMEDPYSQVIVP